MVGEDAWRGGYEGVVSRLERRKGLEPESVWTTVPEGKHVYVLL